MTDRPHGKLTTLQRGILETSLQAMEGGRFQELMIQFLPGYNSRFIGITRYGGTAFGKTRAGVPDLIKTLPTGEEIACVCGTQDNYWTPRKNEADLQKWKPVADVVECQERMRNVVEIVVASNRAIPLDHPGAKSRLIEFVKHRTNAQISPLSSEDISTWFQANALSPDGLELVRQFFPELFESIGTSRRNEELEATLRQSTIAGFPVGSIEKLVRDNFGLSEKQIAELVQEQFGYDSSRFRLAVSTPFCGVKRISSIPDALRAPIGRVVQLNGIPKIGKSWLCHEALEAAALPNNNYRCPTDETLLPEFVDAFLVDLFSEFWSRAEVVAAKRNNGLLQLPPATARIPSPAKVFVIKNAHILRKAELNVLSESIQWLRAINLMKSIAVILITNKSVAPQFPVIDDLCIAPSWTEDQLLELLNQHQIAVPIQHAKSYGELLHRMSGGHPLNALYLARKHPDGAALVKTLVSSTPNPGDPDLSKQLKTLLYQDILTTADKLNLVQRISILRNRADSRMLEWLRLKVSPIISTPIDVLFEEIGGAVLDGDLNTGLAISPTFQNIAKQRISDQEKQSVYRMLASELSKPVGRVFDGTALLESVWYSLLAQDLERAFLGATFALYGLTKKTTDPNITRGVLDRLQFLEWISAPTDAAAKFFYFGYFAAASHCASLAKDQAQASSLIQKIDLDWLQTYSLSKGDQAKMAGELRLAAIAKRAMLLPTDKEPNRVLALYLEEVLRPKAPSHLCMFLEILPVAVTQLPVEQLKALDWKSLITGLGTKDPSKMALLALLMGNVVRQKTELQELLDKPRDSSAMQDFYFALLRASFEFQSDNSAEAAKHLDSARSLAKSLGLPDKKLGAEFLQFVGDVYFEIGKNRDAVDMYERSSSLAEGVDNHVVAWNALRIGVLNEDAPDNSAKDLNRAIALFTEDANDKWAGRAIAISAVVMLRAKRYGEALDAAEQLAGLYSKDHRRGMGPALKLLSAQMLRLISELSGTPLPQPDGNFHALETRLYFKLNDEGLKSDVNALSTCHIFSQLAVIASLRERAIALMRTSLRCEATTPLDFDLRWGSVFTLLTLLQPEEIDWPELESFISLVLQHPIAPDGKLTKGPFNMLLGPFSEHIKREPAKWVSTFDRFLGLISRLTQALPPEEANHWALRIKFARATAEFMRGQLGDATNTFREVYEASIDMEPAVAFWRGELPSLQPLGHMQLDAGVSAAPV